MSSLLSNRNFARSISLMVGTLGWLGLFYGAVVLVFYGQPGQSLGLYGLVPTLVSFALLAAGGRLWSRFGGQAPLGIYVGGAFVAAAALISLIWIASILLFRSRH